MVDANDGKITYIAQNKTKFLFFVRQVCTLEITTFYSAFDLT